MKIALLQLNVIPGALKDNAEKIYSYCQKARGAGAQACVAPLAALCGPEAGSLEKLALFRQKRLETLDWLAKKLCQGPDLLLLARERPHLFLRNGGLEEYPDRSFSGIDFAPLVAPFVPGSPKTLEDEFSRKVMEKGRAGAFVNLAGGYGSLVFYGQSFVMGPDGKLAARAKAFEEDLLLLEGVQGRIDEMPGPDESQWLALVLGTRDFVVKSGAASVLIGLSGGMDSSLVACIACAALGSGNVRGLLLPSPFTSKASLDDASELAKNLGITAFTVPIASLMESFDSSLDPVFSQLPPLPGDLVKENLQARIRAVLLMAVANRTGALVLNTGNLSEAAMGYSTLYGDSIGALAVIGDLFKTRVYELARWHCEMAGRPLIPENVFMKEPSAELRPDQKDSDSLPPYEKLDPILARIAGGEVPETESELYYEILGKACAMQFKRRQAPPPLLVGTAWPVWPLLAKI